MEAERARLCVLLACVVILAEPTYGSNPDPRVSAGINNIPPRRNNLTDTSENAYSNTILQLNSSSDSVSQASNHGLPVHDVYTSHKNNKHGIEGHGNRENATVFKLNTSDINKNSHGTKQGLRDSDNVHVISRRNNQSGHTDTKTATITSDDNINTLASNIPLSVSLFTSVDDQGRYQTEVDKFPPKQISTVNSEFHIIPSAENGELYNSVYSSREIIHSKNKRSATEEVVPDSSTDASTQYNYGDDETGDDHDDYDNETGSETYEIAVPSSQPCDIHHSVIVTTYEKFENGSLLATDRYPMMYPEGMHWEDIDEENNTIVRGCFCVLANCIRKCCPENMTHSLKEEGGCVNSSNDLLYPFKPQFIDFETRIVVKNLTDEIHVVYGDPCPIGEYRIDPLDPDSPEEFFLLPNGTLRTNDESFSVGQYCLEAFDDVQRILPLACFPVEDEETRPVIEDPNMYVLYPIGMIISMPFLLATFCVYAMIPELRNLHGKSLMCHVTTLFVGYVFLAIVQIGGDGVFDGLCVFSAFAIYFSFNASFFWLNVMCFDIWWTFSGLRPLQGSVKEREYKKFVMYSCYAWGAPLVMLGVTLFMDLLPNIPDDFIKPEFGVEKCWFRGDKALLAYFFGPIGVIVLCNIVLFIATAFRIVHLKRETKMLKGGESKRHDEEANRQRFNLYLKLFIVMGVNWIMEVISWAAGGPSYLWYITDLGNTLQGVLIFIIFVWKKKIGRLLARRFCPKLAGNGNNGSIRSHPTPSRTSSYNNYTTRTSVSTNDHLMLKSLPNGSYRVSEVP